MLVCAKKECAVVREGQGIHDDLG
jgi:DNA modification methylase